MKRIVTTCLVLAGLLAATSAMALNMQHKSGVPQTARTVRPFSANVLLGCDDGVEQNAYYQGTDQRLGNLFNFGTGSQLSSVSFTHLGFGLVGPYAYNLEVWDASTCTKVTGVNGLSASDAALTSATENVDVCPSAIILAGDMIVAIDPNTCPVATDCYPDLLFDDQIGVLCPIIIDAASTAPVCYDYSTNSGPFLLRVAINTCPPVPTQSKTWGQLKSLYR